MRDERKVVSVVFVDLVGYTERAERLDPEDARALLASYWRDVRHEIEQFGGTVEKFIGDAVVGLFGAPLVHEDDAERAVRAALSIRDWARDRSDLVLRAAVATGPALVRLGARVEEGEGMVVGDVVTTASRLQEHAPAGGVLVDERTHRATEAAIEYRPLEPVRVKGKRSPVTAWEGLFAAAPPGSHVACDDPIRRPPPGARPPQAGACAGEVDRDDAARHARRRTGGRQVASRPGGRGGVARGRGAARSGGRGARFRTATGSRTGRSARA